MKNLIVIFISLLFLSACEEIPPTIGGGDIEGERVVLVEEFSGGSCVPCATAALVLEEQLVVNEGKLIVVSMHVNEGGQSDPYPGAKHDFRTEKGTMVKGEISTGAFSGIPAGSVNRVLFDGENDRLLRQDKWTGNIAAQRGDTKMNVNIDYDYDTDSRALTLDVTMVPTQNISGEIKLKALITESHILDKQDTPNGLVEDWEHNHILRDYISSLDGRSLGNNLSQPLTETFTYSIPAEDNDLWVAENLEIVVFATEDTPEGQIVLQAATVKLME